MNYLTITKLADLLGANRVTIYRKVKKGEIKAFMVGNTYVINDEEVQKVLNGKLTEADKNKIENVIKRVKNKYGKTLQLFVGDE